MPTVTLAEASKLTQDQLIAGLIQNIITVNQMYMFLPFESISSNAVSYNRENVLGGTAFVGIGDTDGVIGPTASAGTNLANRQAAKNPTTFTKVTSSLVSLIGDAEVNGFVQSTTSGFSDQAGIQIAGKVKHAGRLYQDCMINGTGSDNTFPGLLAMTPGSQQVDTGTNGALLSFDILDQLKDLVLDKDGQVDYIAANRRTIRSYKALVRAAPGTSMTEVVRMTDGASIITYDGIPMLANDYIPINQSKGTSTNTTTIFAGTFDEGGRDKGIAGLTAEKDYGLQVQYVGVHQTKDEEIYRVKWYCGLALFSEKGIASAPGVRN